MIKILRVILRPNQRKTYMMDETGQTKYPSSLYGVLGKYLQIQSVVDIVVYPWENPPGS